MILDTDHLTALQRGDATLRKSLAENDERAVTTIVSIGEQMKGMAALVSGAKSAGTVMASYARMHAWCAQVASLPILGWDDQAAAAFQSLRQQRIRIGTMDLRIAAIALSRNARLLTCRDWRGA